MKGGSRSLLWIAQFQQCCCCGRVLWRSRTHSYKQRRRFNTTLAEGFTVRTTVQDEQSLRTGYQQTRRDWQLLHNFPQVLSASTANSGLLTVQTSSVRSWFSYIGNPHQSCQSHKTQSCGCVGKHFSELISLWLESRIFFFINAGWTSMTPSRQRTACKKNSWWSWIN